MGNCQAIDAASLVIQHPSGRVERLYWPITANEVMKSNPSHYVALIITSSVGDGEKNVGNGVRVTRVKLLKATDMLNLGQAYRLIDSKEVMKGLWAKKYAKMKMKEHESTEKMQNETQKPVCQKEARTTSEVEANNNNNQMPIQEKHRQRGTPSASARGRQWRPSLQSISEAGLSSQGQKTGQQLGRHYERGDVFRSSSS
ncbi:hypothetical protein ACHQM5_008542 [Ranunculus cassubicifolius]